MPKLKLNGEEVEFTPGETVIQVCDRNGVEIPRFCYHERLEIAGNCRMCLVEVKPGPPKPQASCALPAAENQEVWTNTPSVKNAREGVLEFLLINHPLDCPICDQGGECDLQDETLMYGQGKSRYRETKRAVEEKYMGPLIKTAMTRCIHCTRCVRFAEDVAGVPEIGAIYRGEHMEITTLEQAVHSEISANVIDLCPVGALTSRPYAFLARPWELRKTETVDVMDAMGSNIRIDSRGEAVLRVLPRLNEDVNEEWISDKTRYACDGLANQRLDTPYIRENGKLRAASWPEAFDTIAKKLKGIDAKQMAAVAGDLCDAESIFALKGLMNALGSTNLECRQDGAAIDPKDRGSYLFNSTIAGIDEADLVLIIGARPRQEAPLIAARLRKRYTQSAFKQPVPIYNLGAPLDFTVPVTELGQDVSLLNNILSAKHELAEVLRNAKKPMLILGMGALQREDGAQMLQAAKALADTFGFVSHDWNGFNVLHTAASRVAALDLGFVPQDGQLLDVQNLKAVYLLGADEFDMAALGDAFVIYQGSHGDKGAHRADVILPGAAYTEKDGTYVNLEGRVQRGYRAVFPPGEAKEDWKILRALSETLGHTLPFNTIEQLRAKMEAVAPHFAAVDEITPAEWKAGASGKAAFAFTAGASFRPAIANFYMTDPISRASRTMAECTAVMDEFRRSQMVEAA